MYCLRYDLRIPCISTIRYGNSDIRIYIGIASNWVYCIVYIIGHTDCYRPPWTSYRVLRFSPHLPANRWSNFETQATKASATDFQRFRGLLKPSLMSSVAYSGIFPTGLSSQILDLNNGWRILIPPRGSWAKLDALVTRSLLEKLDTSPITLMPYSRFIWLVCMLATNRCRRVADVYVYESMAI